jgi:undecaprenyl-diphosphatase
MNMLFFRLINNLAYQNIFLDKIMLFTSKYLPYLIAANILMVFIVGFIKDNVDYRKVAVNTAILTAINLILNFIIGNIFYVSRPFVNHKVNLLYPHVKDSSFPSDHATATMSIALGLRKFNKTFGNILMVVSLIVGFSRVYVGHHYPSDIIGAYIIVITVSFIYDRTLRKKIGDWYGKCEAPILKYITTTFKKG